MPGVWHRARLSQHLIFTAGARYSNKGCTWRSPVSAGHLRAAPLCLCWTDQCWKSNLDILDTACAHIDRRITNHFFIVLTGSTAPLQRVSGCSGNECGAKALLDLQVDHSSTVCSVKLASQRRSVQAYLCSNPAGHTDKEGLELRAKR